MSDEKRKLNKHSTGTVPKVKYTVKYRNNTGQQQFSNERDNFRNFPNNLGVDWVHRMSETNVPRSTQVTYDLVNSASEETSQNGIYANGTTNSSQTSSSTSRRNSCSTVPKCDNITKYPNKKQIEDKLNQIRDYLHITTSLMSGMKNSEDQTDDANEEEDFSSMIDALRDSEAKLNSLLVNGLEENSEFLGENIHDRKNDFESLNRETGRDLQLLKQKGDSRLREARELQERLARGNNPNQNRMENNLQQFDLTVDDFEESNSRPMDRKGGANNFQQTDEASNYMTEEIEELQNQIQVVHNANEDRKKLMQLLDKRDAELRSQHLELQNKLTELQTKKSQVDHLVAALQNGKEKEDMGSLVRTVITMKDELEKLKDMLAIVESTEVLMHNGTQEEQAAAWEICSKAESFLNKYLSKGNGSNQSQLENHLALQYDSRASPSLNMDRSKLLNKNSRDSRSQSNDSNSKVNEKHALQAELRAKKRELEEIMGKHKASSSNLNHDVGTDNKSEFSCNNSLFDNGSGVWTPLLPMQHNQPESSDRYSSDEGAEDVNEYVEITSSQQNQAILPPSASATAANIGKFPVERNVESEAQAYEPLERHYFFRGDGNATGTTIASEATSSFSRDSSVSNVGQGEKQNVQKQLELIRSVCDSMLPQPTPQANVHQLRNHLTPSPTYSDLRQFTTPNPHSINALNVANPQIENVWPPGSGQPNVSFPDATNYQNWLTTNTLQTQAFMLNSLNQCCQMLWLQQRELANLRGLVTTLQERLSNPHYSTENQMATSSNQSLSCNQVEPPSVMTQSIPPINPCSPNLNQSRPMNPKQNTVPSACSLPNINQYNPSPITVVDPILANQNNLRLMDSTLNNLNVMNNSDHMRNLASLQNAGDNINALPGHMWARHALNNQVPPGNRANNYWDNFRSYSRQNLFSTKSNDCIQNSPIIDRTNNVMPRSTPFEGLNLPKSNSQQMSVSPQENIPQRSCVRPSRRYPNTNIAIVPPDVLNINQNIKNDGFPLTPIQNESRNVNETESSAPSGSIFPNNASRMPRRHSNIVAPSVENLQNPRRRNASNESVNTDGNSRSRLFEELRENVYKEVASLISANEARPHFLIQLFRDLQLVSSDPLRLKTLQSIQVLISQSFRNSQNLTSQEPSPNLEVPPSSNEFSMQSTVWSPIPPNSVPKNATILEGLLSKKGDVTKFPNIFHEIIPFLNDNEHHIIDQSFLVDLKQNILEVKSFRKVVRDTIFQKHFSNVLDHVLSFYIDKPLSSVKMSLLQSVRELLDRELSFMNLIQSSGESQLNDLVASSSQNPGLVELQPPQQAVSSDTIELAAGVQIQNGDLAEADQSHVEDQDMEEEGAVGGILEPPTEQIGTSVVDMNKEDGDQPSSSETFATSTEAESQYQLGLDQVPTRLPIKSKSRSNTPSKDRMPKTDSGEHLK